MSPTPEYATLPHWCALTGMTRTATYLALSRRDIRAIKLGRRTLIHGGSFAVHAQQIRRRSGRHASYEKFSQTFLLFFR